MQSQEFPTAKEVLVLPKWKAATEVELNSIEQNHTWELVLRPQHRQIIGLKWIFKIKYHADGTLDKLKAHSVAKDTRQVEGVEYGKTFAPTTPLLDVCLHLLLTTNDLSSKWMSSQFFLMVT